MRGSPHSPSPHSGKTSRARRSLPRAASSRAPRLGHSADGPAGCFPEQGCSRGPRQTLLDSAGAPGLPKYLQLCNSARTRFQDGRRVLSGFGPAGRPAPSSRRRLQVLGCAARGRDLEAGRAAGGAGGCRRSAATPPSRVSDAGRQAAGPPAPAPTAPAPADKAGGRRRRPRLSPHWHAGRSQAVACSHAQGPREARQDPLLECSEVDTAESGRQAPSRDQALHPCSSPAQATPRPAH